MILHGIKKQTNKQHETKHTDSHKRACIIVVGGIHLVDRCESKSSVTLE